MKNNVYRKLFARLNRIESKCDRIICELAGRGGDKGIDDAIERMHRNALRMRQQCEQDRRTIAEFLKGQRL